MSLRSSLRTEGVSVRSIFTFVLVVAITALFWATFGSGTPAHATDATWNGASISHGERQYLSVGESSGEESHNIPKGSIYYASIEEVSAEDEAPNRDVSYKAHVIYFSPGTDPPVETTATYLNYDYEPSTKTFSSPSAPQTIKIDPTGSNEEVTSCAIEGVGWIVCSLSNFLAEGMDFIFGVLTNFMEVQPINVSNTDGDLYIAWDIMRNIANVAFIIAFTIIIYSQLTSFGVSNYGLKKLLPRLIISAILVNMSFVISAIAVDISNIFGYSLQDIFMQIRNDSFGIDEGTWSESVTDWKTVTAVVLSGGTAAAVGIGSLIVSTGGTATGAIFLLLPALVGLLLAVLVVILILAARQAIIIILVIIAPLAFVAYLLPNTEKWFDKWKDVFMTMLIFFPAFSVVFGGSQLAGAVIIQNASSLLVVILGMIVQVAPLVITPLILKFSGNLLGKIAGIVNNPNKGILDRTRKWAGSHQEYHKARGISGSKFNGAPGELRRRNVARNLARRSEQRRRNLEAKTKNAGAHMDNEYHKSKGYRSIHENAHEIGLDKERIEADHSAHINKSTNVRGGKFYVKNLELESAKAEMEHEKIRTQRVSDDYRSGLMNIEQPADGASKAEKAEAEHLSRLATRMSRSSIELAAETRASVAAKQAQQQSYAKALEQDAAIKIKAGGIDPNGQQRAYAEAISIIKKNQQENIDNIKTIISYKGYTDSQRVEIVNGVSQDGLEASTEARAAAIESLMEAASPATLADLIKDIEFEDVNAEDKKMLLATYGTAMEKSKFRPAFFDFGRTAKMKQGLNPDNTPIIGAMGESGAHDMIMGVINKRTLSVSAMQEMFSPYVSMINDTIRDRVNNIDELSSKDIESLGILRDRLHKVLDPSTEGYAKLGDSEQIYKGMLAHIESVIGRGQNPQ